MTYGYAIQIASETLGLLASDKNYEYRLERAFSEIQMITANDISDEHIQDLSAINNLYFQKQEDVRNDLGRMLASLCVAILEHNSRNTSESFDVDSQ